jgi:hypothetical protein
MPRKGNETHSATDLIKKTELPNNKGVRFFILPFWRTVGVYFGKSLVLLVLVISVFCKSLVNIYLTEQQSCSTSRRKPGFSSIENLPNDYHGLLVPP